MRQVTVRQLQMFAAAAQARSFAVAAEKLHVSPAAVSFQVRQLESMSGFALFERLGRHVALSDAGRALLGYANTVLRALDDADQSLTALRGATGGRVVIGLTSTAKYIVPHLLARFQTQHPGVVIHLRDGNRQEIVAALESGEIELAVMGQPPAGADVVAAPFADHPSVLVASPSHELAHARAPMSPTRIAGERVILREEGSGTRGLLERFLADSGVTLRSSMTTSSNETIKQAVMAGMGMALLSRHTLGLELALGMMAIVPVQGLPLMRSWYVAHRRTLPLLPVHTRLRDFLLTEGQSVIDALERGFTARAAGLGAKPARKRPEKPPRSLRIP